MSKYAIVGLACLFPGAESPAEFWRNLRSGEDSRKEGGTEVFGPGPEARDIDPQHEIYCTRGGFVTDFAFDPTGYRLDADRLAGLDRIFHWTLHVAREALRDSGHGDRRDVLARTGLVLGNYSFPTPTSAQVSVPLVQEAVLEGLRRAGHPPLGALAHARDRIDRERLNTEDLMVSGAPATLAATALGLGGPRYSLDAACSSALYALKLACDHLAAGQADLVLAGGVCAPDPTLIHLSFGDLQAYPRDGFSQPFDGRSGGILTGQGAGMFAVKRLEDAVRDGDRVHAVVDGIGLSNDGSGRHLLVPQGHGQLQSYELAYADAGVDPAAVDYLECHATGTPIGDATEAQSVADFFGEAGRVPLLGSVKGNIGHLLTVAGLSSMLKVVLAMGQGHIPPTIGVGQPISSKDGRVGPDALVREGRDWPETAGPRRAGVSAFGFGGTNAHVVLSQPDGTAPVAEPRTPVPALDIVGLGAHFGSFDSLDAYERAVHAGADTVGPLPERRWRGLDQTRGGSLDHGAGVSPEALPQGAFVDGLGIDPMDLKIPPADLRTYNLQHALAIKVADEALKDAGYSRAVPKGQSAPDPRRIAVVVAMETEPFTHLRITRYGLGTFIRQEFARAGIEVDEAELARLTAVGRDAVVDPIVANEVLSYIGNVMASRISSLWNLTGPSFTVSSDGSGTAEALQVARLLLLDPGIEAVLVGAVDLAGSAENLLLRPDVVAEAGLTFQEGAEGRRIGEGAGAVVVTRPDSGDRPVYARLESLAIRHADPVDGAVPEADAATYAAAASEAYTAAGITASDVGYVEAHAGGTDAQDRAEIEGLAQVHPAGGHQVALGSAKAQIGDAGCAAGMAGLIRTVLGLHHGYVPGTRGWTRPTAGLTAGFEASGLYVPDASRPWLRARRDSRRYAAVGFIGAAGAHGHLVLSARTSRGALVPRDWRRAGGPVVLPLSADSFDGLLATVARHRALLDDGADPYALARDAARQLPGRTLRAVLVGRDRDELAAQLDLAARGLPAAHAEGGEWATPAGSCFTADPIGAEGKVALVYPGAFNSYPGLGQELFRAFPGLLDTFEDMADEPELHLRAAALYPRSQAALGRRELMALEGSLGDDIPFMLATGTSFSILYTDLVREVLGVRAHGGFGYSLGESSMLFATRGWLPESRDDALISGTPVFKHRLVGAKDTVREAWGIGADVPDERVWSSHVLLTDAETVRTALKGYDRVFLTHINTPKELVVAGDPAQCRALIEELGCPAARSPVGAVMHCSVVNADFDALAGLNSYPTGSFGDLELFSAYDYAPLPAVDRAETARRIATTLCAPIDFPRLVRTAYDRGFRYFLEAGPSATCARWVRETLGDAPHMAAPLDRRGVPATRSIAQLAARLTAHGLDLDWDALLAATAADAPARPTRFRVGGADPAPARIARELARGARTADATATGEAPAAGPVPVPTAAGSDAPVSGPPAGQTAGSGASTSASTSPAPDAVGASPTVSSPVPGHVPGRTAVPSGPALAGSGEGGRAGSPQAPRRHHAAAHAAPTAPAPSAPPEDSALMHADPTLADAEVIAFDGTPVSTVPWSQPPRRGVSEAPRAAAAPAGPEPAAPAPAGPAAQQSGAASETPAADLVREIRRQMLDTHSVVMETQHILQSATLGRVESLLDGTTPASPMPRALPAPAEPAALAPAPAVERPALPAAPPAPVAPAPAIPAAPAASAPAAPVPPEPAPAADREVKEGVIWDEADLLEFAVGSVAKVFGPEFGVIDGYGKRVRLPAPPYHFVTRVTDIEGTTGEFKPAKIVTEYDVPEDAWYAVDGYVPPAVTVEAGQCDLLLVSYLGIDFRNKGERVYRLLDSTLVFRGFLPRVGQTLRYEISIDRFVHQGETTIFFFSYQCYADGELILELRDACAGFFTQAELDTPLGVVMTEKEKKARAALPKGYFKPLAYTDKNHLDAEDLELLAQGRPGDVFGPDHAQDPGINPALRLPDAKMRMIDEVDIDRKGGLRGLGKITATKNLQPDGWYFLCHFPDDHVLAGSLVAEGAVQLLQIYLMHQGMHLTLPDARFTCVTDTPIEVQVRGQITQKDAKIRYEVEVMELTLLPRATVIADVLIYLDDKPVVRMKNLGLQVREKEGTPYRPETGGVPRFLGRRNRDGEAAMINEMHLAHAAKGLLDIAMGPEFEVYRTSRAPYIPNGDFQFVDRVMSLEGTRGDLSPGSVMVTEYDSPADAWYYEQNSFPHMPNCVYMESSLQAAIFLGYYLGATLKNTDEQYRIRNLDGRATLVKDIDLRGKTIRHTSKLLMTSAVHGAVLQNFSYELSADGEVFYTGESLFGYFSDAALVNQVGLDNGKYVAPWMETEKPAADRVRRIELPEGAPAFTDPTGGSLHLPGEKFALVDHVDLITDGGKHGRGYVHGYRAVRPDEWYFDCHFHRDPVMPGSLGVEAVLQAMRLFVLEQNLAEGIENPRFAMATDVETSWKYRGQILRHDKELFFDVHVKDIRKEDGRLVLVADADLWKPGLRIYELTDLAIEVRTA
ncbi:beta-ketoacyl synthase N-terminal-like domain-containing protein [Streptomyces sp. NPDC005017]|uniref:beta-ketoacyl synthase N-terminal-like domain-containing protein n=1 Tax=Streptomyces sp. NPDC005017 TaxID=3364706 RepID=UPI0036B2BD83